MKAVIYAVRRHSRWEWRVSLDFRVDLNYWFWRDPEAKIKQLDASLSFGQAILLQQQITSHPKNGLLQLKGLAGFSLIEWDRRKYIEYGTLGTGKSARVGQVAGIGNVAGGEGVTHEWMRGQADSGSGSSGYCAEVDLHQLEQMCKRLEGRSLLLEEVASLLQTIEEEKEAASAGMSAGREAAAGVTASASAETVAKIYVQTAYLLGRITFVPGIKVAHRKVRLEETSTANAPTAAPAPEPGAVGHAAAMDSPPTGADAAARVAPAKAVTVPAGIAGAFRKRQGCVCRRCGSGSERLHWTLCASCGEECPYCEECLTMGRVRFCLPLIQGVRIDAVTAAAASREAADPRQVEERISPWKLSPAQAEASASGIRYMESSDARQFLIWAVTGAGKTEMIYPLIETELNRGGSVLVATPRKDVVLELAPRLQQAFPHRNLVTLYGGSEQRWDSGEITLATTHQLLRFYRKFDLVIIDELDAFPFHNNPVLQYAAEKACRLSGKYIFLSATPPRPMQKAVSKNKLPHVKVPVRFHRHPLPVPGIIRVKSLKELQRGLFSAKLLQEIDVSLQRGAQLFIFVPRIKDVPIVVERLIQQLNPLPDGQAVSIQGTSSKDPERVRRVQDFRNGKIRILVTTTILERGVTVPKTDVLILDADSPLFDEASLVQIAGRAGRSKDDPRGRVLFAAAEKTRSQVRAIRQIRAMNRLAKKKGYLLT